MLHLWLKSFFYLTSSPRAVKENCVDVKNTLFRKNTLILTHLWEFASQLPIRRQFVDSDAIGRIIVSNPGETCGRRVPGAHGEK